MPPAKGESEDGASALSLCEDIVQELQALHARIAAEVKPQELIFIFK